MCSASNYAEGHYTLGRDILDKSLDRIRKMSESCNNLAGFLIYHSLCGGTGSGFGTLLLERLSVDYKKIPKATITQYQSQKYASNIVEPYNVVLANQHMTEHADLTISFNNQALYKICHKLELEMPTMPEIN